MGLAISLQPSGLSPPSCTVLCQPWLMQCNVFGVSPFFFWRVVFQFLLVRFFNWTFLPWDEFFVIFFVIFSVNKFIVFEINVFPKLNQSGHQTVKYNQIPEILGFPIFLQSFVILIPGWICMQLVFFWNYLCLFAVYLCLLAWCFRESTLRPVCLLGKENQEWGAQCLLHIPFCAHPFLAAVVPPGRTVHGVCHVPADEPGPGAIYGEPLPARPSVRMLASWKPGFDCRQAL